MSGKRSILLATLPAYFVLGAIAYLVPRTPPAALLLGTAWILMTNLLIAQWCRADAREKPAPFPPAMLWLVVLLGPVGLVVHLLRTRSIGKALVAMLLAFGFGVILMQIYSAGFRLTMWLYRAALM